MCLGMFTTLPMLYRPWDEKLRPLMTACLPGVGLIIGAIWLLTAYLCRVFSVHPALAAAFVTAMPSLVTGAIHIDGFMDTSDAVLSWRPLEKRLEILKDPHVGSFAVISLAALSLFTYGAAFALMANGGPIYPLLLIPMVSRCCSAFCVAKLKPLSHSEYAAENYTSGSDDDKVWACMDIAAAYRTPGLASLQRCVSFFKNEMKLQVKDTYGFDGEALPVLERLTTKLLPEVQEDGTLVIRGEKAAIRVACDVPCTWNITEEEYEKNVSNLHQKAWLIDAAVAPQNGDTVTLTVTLA